MKLLTVGYEGAEEVMQKEIKELINADSKTEPSVAIADLKNRKDFFNNYTKLAYVGQSFSTVIELLGSFKISQFEDINNAEKLDFKKLKDYKFRVSCTRIGEHDFSSGDIEAKLGEIIINKEKTKVDLRKPEIKVMVYIYNNKCYIGYDYAILELDKRDYKVYNHPKSIKGLLAFTLIRLVGYDSKKTLLDPFCHSGEIAIEAAYFKSKFPINFYRKDKFGPLIDRKLLDEIDSDNVKSKKTNKIDSKKTANKKVKIEKPKIFAFDADLRNIKATKQNATIGGIKNYLEISKIDPEWIDVKLDEKSIDLIVSNPDAPNRDKNIEKKYEEFFYNAEFVLKKKSKILVISNKLLRKVAEKKGFKLEKTIELKKGKQILEVDVYCF